MDELKELQLRLAALERRQKLFRLACIVVLLALGTSWALSRAMAQSLFPNVLRVRGLIIEDENGRARLLLGAPIPSVSERRRRDTTVGMVILNEAGTDRVQVGVPLPGPQMRGVVSDRVSPVAGLVFNGPDGNERGGLGVQDDGTAAFGLDHQNGREAVHLVVAPSTGFSGLLIHAEDGSRDERAILGVMKDGRTLLKLADPSGRDRMTLTVTHAANQFVIAGPGDTQATDILKSPALAK